MNDNSLKATMIRFLKFLSPYWKKGAWAFLFMLLSVGLQLPLPFLTKYLIDEVVAVKSFKLLNLIGLVLIGFLIIRAVSNLLQSYLLASFRGRVLFDVRVKLFERVQRASLSFFHGRQTGYLMSRLSDDVDAVQGLLAETLVTAGQSILTFIAGIICTIYIHPKLALICFAVLPLYVVSIAIFNRRIRSLSMETREQFALVQKDLQELLSGMSLIKAFTAEGRATIRLISGLKRAIRAEVRMDITAALASISSAMISAIGPVALIWYGCGEIMRGNLTIGGLLAFSSFIGYLFGPVQVLYELNVGIQRSLAAVERIFEIMDVEPEGDAESVLSIPHGRVTYDGVSFSYGDNEAVLRDISFEIPPGRSAAIVGRSGAGKTTLASLLLKFYQPSAGRICIDGRDIGSISLKSLRSQIGLVAQDSFLFSDTIKENIRFGRPDASDEEIENAAKMAHAHEFIMDMPDGYLARIGERGCTLSGGQRQRVSIARAILKDPKILILDEATSQVDNESERLIQEALEKFMKGRTTIIIAHRLSTVEKADMIMVLHEGRIVDRGRHFELLAKEGIYR